MMSVAIAALILMFGFTAQAQDREKKDYKRVEFGLRFMPTISAFKMQTSDGSTVKGEMTLGWGAGAFLGYYFSNSIGIQAEAIYSDISRKYTENDVQRKVNLSYINFPVMISLNTGKSRLVNLNLVAGPQIGVLVGSRVSSSSNDGVAYSAAQLSVKKTDLGFAYGAGIDVGLNEARSFRLGLGFRGVYGLIDISDNSSTTTTDSYYILDRTHVQTYSMYTGISFLF